MEEQEKREETKEETETKENNCKCNSCQVERLIKGLCEIRLKYGPYFLAG